MTFRFRIRCRLKPHKHGKRNSFVTIHDKNRRQHVRVNAGSIEAAVEILRRNIGGNLEYLAIERSGFSRTIFGTQRHSWYGKEAV